jgi:hypothetical protein
MYRRQKIKKPMAYHLPQDEMIDILSRLTCLQLKNSSSSNTTRKYIKSSRYPSSIGAFKRATNLMVIFVIIIQILLLSNVTHSANIIYLHWNTTNSM